MQRALNIGIVGGTGYTGVELLRLLVRHPHAKLRAITSRKEAGSAVADMFPSLRGHTELRFAAPDDAPLHDCDVVFFATPHGVAMQQAQQFHPGVAGAADDADIQCALHDALVSCASGAMLAPEGRRPLTPRARRGATGRVRSSRTRP